MKLHELTLRTVRLPLIRPYVLSYRTFTEFEPIIVEARDADGRIGWGEGHISPGSSSETREGGWAFCREHAAAIVGKDTTAAKAMIAANIDASKVAATALLTAIEMLEDHPLLRSIVRSKLPLLTPFNSSAPKEIAEEVERRLEDGFRTFKIKVGKNADRRRKTCQGDPASHRRPCHDAARRQSRLSSEADACRFAAALDPSGIELFEQPCDCRGLGGQCQGRKRLARSSHAGRADLRACRRGARRRHQEYRLLQAQAEAVRRSRPRPPRRSMRCAHTAWSRCLATGSGSSLDAGWKAASRESPSAMLASSTDF